MSQAIIDKLLNLAKEARVKLTLTQARQLVADNPGRYAKTLLKIHQASLEPPKPPKKRGRPPKNPQAASSPQANGMSRAYGESSYAKSKSVKHQTPLARASALSKRVLSPLGESCVKAYAVEQDLKQKEIALAQKPDEPSPNLAPLGYKHLEIPENIKKYLEALGTCDPENPEIRVYRLTEFSESLAQHCLNLQSLNRGISKSNHLQALNPVARFSKNPEGFQLLVDGLRKFDKRGLSGVEYFSNLLDLTANSLTADSTTTVAKPAAKAAESAAAQAARAQNLELRKTWRCSLSLIQAALRALDWMQYEVWGNSLSQAFFSLQVQEQANNLGKTWDEHDIVELIQETYVNYGRSFSNLGGWLNALEFEIIERYTVLFPDAPELHQLIQLHRTGKQSHIDPEMLLYCVEFINLFSQMAQQQTEKALADNPELAQADQYVNGYKGGASLAEAQPEAKAQSQAETTATAEPTKTKKARSTAQPAYNLFDLFAVNEQADGAADQTQDDQTATSQAEVQANAQAQNPAQTDLVRLSASAPTLKKQSTYCLLVEPAKLKALLEPVAAHAAQDSFFASFPSLQSPFASLSQTAPTSAPAGTTTLKEASLKAQGSSGTAPGKVSETLPFSLSARHQLTLVLQPINGINDHASDLVVAYVGKQAIGAWVQPSGTWLDDVLQQVKKNLGLPSLKHAFFYTSLPLKPRQAQILQKHGLTFVIDLNNTTRLDDLDKNYLKQLRAPLEIHADVYTAFSQGEKLFEEVKFKKVTLRNFDPVEEVKKVRYAKQVHKVVNYNMLDPQFQTKAQQGDKFHIQALTHNEFVSGYYQPKNYAAMLGLGHKPGVYVPLVKETTSRHCDGLSEWTKSQQYDLEAKKVIPPQQQNTATRFREMMAGTQEQTVSMSRPYLEAPALEYFLVYDLDLTDKIARRNSVLEAFAGYLPQLLQAPDEVLEFTVEDGVRVYGDFSEDQAEAYLEIDYRKFYKATPDIYLTNFFGCLPALVASDENLQQVRSEEEFSAVLNTLYAIFDRLSKDLQNLLPLKTINEQLEQVTLEHAEDSSYQHLPPHAGNYLSLRDLVAKFSFKN